ncbi:MAG: tetratricopeptide repeat protein [Alphaproteobacteria bacterium]|nr:tetratricopeptide repeat protein [Alphaproteobacteria bacterium]
MLRLLSALFLCLPLLAACADRMQVAENVKKDVEKAKGPEIAGISDTVLASVEAAEKAGDYEKAISILTPFATGQEVKDERLLSRYAGLLRKARKFDEAIRYYNRVLAIKPEDIDALEGKALSLVDKGQLDEADPVLTKVISKDNKRWKALNAAGISFSLRNRINEALQYYKAALEVSPNNVTVLNNIGLAMAFNRDFENATTFLERARSLATDEFIKKRLDLNLSLVHGIAGNMEKAEQYARPHLSQPALYNNMGLYAYLNKNEDVAKSYLNMALSGSVLYYDKAWKNLETMTKGGAPAKPEKTSGSKAVKVPQEEGKSGKKTDDKKSEGGKKPTAGVLKAPD